MTYIGDGGTSTGAFHEGMNFAAVQKLPLVVIAEDNKYAYSTPIASRWRLRASTCVPRPTVFRTRWWTATTCSPSTRRQCGR